MTPLQQIASLFAQYGHLTYEETCTQVEHAQQCASLAKHKGYCQATQIAAFLHDIGHFIAQHNNHPELGAYGYSEHGELGAHYLSQWGFADDVTELVRHHVTAKRYLMSVKPHYGDSLSAASSKTLEQQGGKMTAQAIVEFRRHPLFNDIIALRMFDDLGKQDNARVLDNTHWFAQIDDYLSARR